MNFGKWKIKENKDNGNCVFYHFNENTREYEPVKVFKIPYSHKLKKTHKQQKYDKNKNKKCVIS